MPLVVWLNNAAAEYADTLNVPVSTIVRLAHSPGSAIVHTVAEKQVDYAVMGWRGNTSDPTTQIGKNIDYIGNHANANANVVVLERTIPEEARSILVPIS